MSLVQVFTHDLVPLVSIEHFSGSINLINQFFRYRFSERGVGSDLTLGGNFAVWKTFTIVVIQVAMYTSDLAIFSIKINVSL